MQVLIQFQEFLVNFKTYRVGLRDHLYFNISIILSLFFHFTRNQNKSICFFRSVTFVKNSTFWFLKMEEEILI